MVLTKIGYGLSGLLGAGIIVIGARFLAAPQAAAAAYGITTEQSGPASDPYLAAKGVRDIASGIVVFVLFAAGKPHILGRYPPTEQRTRWFNRILNIVHAHAPTAKIILVRNPADTLPAIGRVLGDSAPEH
jgi:hypothetical protein